MWHSSRTLIIAMTLGLISVIYGPFGCAEVFAAQEAYQNDEHRDRMPVVATKPSNTQWFASMSLRQEWIKDLEVKVNQKNR